MVKTPATEQWVQNVNYELIPGEDNFWKVRVLTGPFIETVFQFGAVGFNELDFTVKFDYNIWYTPHPDLKAGDDEFEKVAANILHSLLIGLLDEDMNGRRANNSPEPTDG
jgi:hypothetical protein